MIEQIPKRLLQVALVPATILAGAAHAQTYPAAIQSLEQQGVRVVRP